MVRSPLPVRFSTTGQLTSVEAIGFVGQPHAPIGADDQYRVWDGVEQVLQKVLLPLQLGHLRMEVVGHGVELVAHATNFVVVHDLEPLSEIPKGNSLGHLGHGPQRLGHGLAQRPSHERTEQRQPQ
jgi:hypothetical protein